MAAQSRDVVLRSVRGVVTDSRGTRLASSIVYLHDPGARTVRTYIVDEEGKYRFSGLRYRVEYELHAAHEDRTSSTRKVSSHSTQKDIVVDLKVDKKKPGI